MLRSLKEVRREMKQKAMEESQQKPHVPQFPAPSPPVSESGFHSTASVIMDEIEEEMDDKPVAAPVALPKPVVKPKTTKRSRGKASSNAWKRFDPAAFDNDFNAKLNNELTTSDPTKIQAMLDKYGCCIFGPVLSPRQCEDIKAAIWGAMKAKSNPMHAF